MKYVSVLCLSLLVFGCDSPEKKLSLDDVLESVSGDSIKSHIAYLADDNLRGRLPGTPEYDLAVNYVISQYNGLGLEPAGSDGFLQQITIRTSMIDESASSLSIKKQDTDQILQPGVDYIFLGDLNNSSNEISAPLEFVGYGISAPQLDFDDYSEKDVSGKVVISAGGAPESFASTERAHFSNFLTKFEAAVEHGAVGFILLTPANSFMGSAERFRTSGNTGVVGPDGEAFGRRVFDPDLKFVALMNWDSFGEVAGVNISEWWNSYKNGETLILPSELIITAKTTTQYSEFSSPNVIGKLTGSDEVLKDEYVVHTAHLDHVGVGRPVNGDSIYNGAHDNASGVAAMLEIARVYTLLPEKPKRSILFIAVTAEEMGLLGSDYYSRFPTVDINKIVANVNTDMPTLIAPLLSIEPLGAEHSSLMNNVKDAAQKLNLEIMPDHMPEQVRFVRSDQYNFIRQGIPALHVKYGLKSMDSLNDLSQQINDYTQNVYHKPSDELNDLFDFKAGEVYVKLNFLISYSIAQEESPPVWNQGDFFSKN